MSRYTYSQLVDLAEQVGFPKSVAPTMAAIALAESGGRTDAINTKNKNGTTDRGLWQINSVHGFSGALSMDPVQNARQALQVWKSQGLKAWTTYKNGAYEKYIKGGSPAADSSGGGGMLRQGSRGADVKALQQKLGVSADGIFGPQTEKAVKAYQKAHGLAVDGIAGPATLGSLGISSGGSAGSGGSVPVTTGNDAADYAAAHYGYLAAFLNDPEIGPIIKQAAAEHWDEDTPNNPVKLQAALSATNWWKTTSATARQYDAQKITDPATVEQALQAQTKVIKALAVADGIHVSDQDAQDIAETSLRYGWSSQQLTEAVGAEFHYTAGQTYQGDAATAIQTIKQAYSDYLLPVSDGTINDLATNILKGDLDPASVKAQAAQQAKGMFKAFANDIDAGMTMRQIADPYVQTAAQLLDLNPAAIDLTKPMWQTALTGGRDQGGAPAPMSLSQWQTTLRTDPTYGFDHSATGIQAAAQIGSTIMSTFGSK